MSLWEYLWSWSTVTKWLRHLNGNSNDGSWNGNNWSDTSMTYGLNGGRFWQWWTFNGSSSSINLGTSTTLRITTITAHIRARTTTQAVGTGMILVKKARDLWWHFAYWLWLWFNATWKIFVRIQTASTPTFRELDIAATFDDGKWHHYCFSYNSTWWVLKLYMDWALIWSSSWGGTIYYQLNTNARIWSSQFTWSGAPESYFTWDIDEVFIEERIWTDAEVQKYYTYAKWSFWIQ